MTKQQNDIYKGYTIVTDSSGGNSPPYTAGFGVAPVKSDGTHGPVENRICDARYQTEDEAHTAANIAARMFIDTKKSR